MGGTDRKAAVESRGTGGDCVPLPETGRVTMKTMDRRDPHRNAVEQLPKGKQICLKPSFEYTLAPFDLILIVSDPANVPCTGAIDVAPLCDPEHVVAGRQNCLPATRKLHHAMTSGKVIIVAKQGGSLLARNGKDFSSDTNDFVLVRSDAKLITRVSVGIVLTINAEDYQYAGRAMERPDRFAYWHNETSGV